MSRYLTQKQIYIALDVLADHIDGMTIPGLYDVCRTVAPVEFTPDYGTFRVFIGAAIDSKLIEIDGDMGSMYRVPKITVGIACYEWLATWRDQHDE